MAEQPPDRNADEIIQQTSPLDSTHGLQPVSPDVRMESVDFLRGFALLGILVINIGVYALPAATLFNPLVAGGMEGANLATWQVSYIVFYQKMMGIFSMLFGAGIILMSKRADDAGRPFGAIYYRRILWLGVIGLLHAYLLWYGDILFPYALAGLLLYPLRKLRPRVLVMLGILVLAVGLLLQFGAGYMFTLLRSQAEGAQSAIAAGETPNQQQEAMLQAWEGILDSFDPASDKLAAEVDAMRGGYWGMVKFRALYTLMMHVQALPMYLFWRVMGMMLLGMALMKMGVFSAERTPKFYLMLLIGGYIIGFSLTGYSMRELLAANFDFVFYFRAGGLYDYVGAVFVSLGHVGLLMTIFKSGAIHGVVRRFAAVGRMALTNYLSHTVICTILFCGVGFGLFNRIERFGLILIVFGIWLLQLFVSPIWLRYFRFGPAEWAWRTVTYMKRQPMRISAE